MEHIRSTDDFRERLLSIMDRKHHWAWEHFSGSGTTKDQLRIHFRQEYAVYVRDFPVFLARVYGNNPPSEVRALLAENIYEEDTGRLSVGESHPNLFLTMMKGLGYDPDEFRNVELLPASRAYRQWLEEISIDSQWVQGAAALTILVEGSINDRKELQAFSVGKSPDEIEAAVKQHPLVQFHGVSPQAMDLIRAHQMVEAGHRQAAYAIVLNHALEPEDQRAVLNCLEKGLGLWLKYRDGVAHACGFRQP